MFEGHVADVEGSGERLPGGGSAFASDVVALLLTRGTDRPAVLDDALLQRFMSVILSSDVQKVSDLRQEFRRLRVTPNALAEIYIPEAARRFGEAWLADRMSFCEVTMGSARLQAVLRELTSGFFDEEHLPSEKGTVLVVVPQEDQHTLGGLSLAWQLRRRGISVCLQIAPSLPHLHRLAANRRFDGVFVSASSDRYVPALKTLVNALKKVDNASRLVVALGGPILEIDPAAAAEVGADILTNDINRALDAVGVQTTRPLAGRF